MTREQVMQYWEYNIFGQGCGRFCVEERNLLEAIDLDTGTATDGSEPWEKMDTNVGVGICGCGVQKGTKIQRGTLTDKTWIHICKPCAIKGGYLW